MLILSGAQGCGKSTFVNLLKVMFGKHFFSTSKPEQNVWGRFNDDMESRTLVELSELDRGNIHGSIDHVKDLISNDMMWIEGKGKNGYTVQNYVRFLGITNNPVPVSWPIGTLRASSTSTGEPTI
jgi:phage/plasmid-associated DNA primase